MLVWTDLETTGLDPRECSILEVSAIVTDDRLSEVARYSRVLFYHDALEIASEFALLREMEVDLDSPRGKESLKQMSERYGVKPIPLCMHDTNGLWAECARSTLDRHFVELDFAAFVCEHAVPLEDVKDEAGNVTGQKPNRPQLAGSTISFDREFLYQLPTALAVLHYRNVDVSTLNELARRFWPDVYAARPNNETKAHRGMADIEESIRVCKHYLNSLAPQAVP